MYIRVLLRKRWSMSTLFEGFKEEASVRDIDGFVYAKIIISLESGVHNFLSGCPSSDQRYILCVGLMWWCLDFGGRPAEDNKLIGSLFLNIESHVKTNNSSH